MSVGEHRDISKYLIHTCWIIRGAHGDEGTEHDQWVIHWRRPRR